MNIQLRDKEKHKNLSEMRELYLKLSKPYFKLKINKNNLNGL